GQDAPCRDRSAWFAYYRGISCVGKHKRQRRVRRSKTVNSHLRSEGQRTELRSGNEVPWPVELLGTDYGNRKNTSADRPNRAAHGADFALNILVTAAINRLSVSAILFGIIAGIVSIGAGLLLGFALGALAAAFHVSTFEGEAGYFAVAIALIVTFIVTHSRFSWRFTSA